MTTYLKVTTGTPHKNSREVLRYVLEPPNITAGPKDSSDMSVQSSPLLFESTIKLDVILDHRW